MTILERIVGKIRRFVVPLIPRWLGSWILESAMDRCTVDEDWPDLPIGQFYERWHDGVDFTKNK